VGQTTGRRLESVGTASTCLGGSGSIALQRPEISRVSGSVGHQIDIDDIMPFPLGRKIPVRKASDTG